MKTYLLFAGAIIVGFLVSQSMADCGNFFAAKQVVAVKQAAIVHHAAVEPVVVDHFQAYRTGYNLRSESVAEQAALRALQLRDDSELKALRAEIQAIRQAIGQSLSAGGAASAGGCAPPAAVSNSLITKHCGKCHGAQLASPKGGLYIDASANLDCDKITQSLRYLGGVEEPPGAMQGVIENIPSGDFPGLMTELLNLEK